MEQNERQLVIDRLNSSRERLGNLTASLTAEQWRFSPGEGRWSIGECVEHVTRVEKRVFGLVEQKLAENPEPAKATPEQKAKDDEVARLVADRSTPRTAPEPARPTGEWSDASELVDDFEKTRRATTDFTLTTRDNLRNYFIPHGVFGELDCYQWLLLVSVHGARHAEQIEQIKAAPGYPTN
jgi:hypothetical protein